MYHFSKTFTRYTNRFCGQQYSTRKLLRDGNINKLRNIGIMAHIDAGKTTTTERMLFYAGTINQMGEVHHGTTVTDYMDQERERGITIRSAAVSFMWKDHQFNLIDTPGHIDFTMEVEQTLSVLDGAIIVLDASAGVEAQTSTVWQQADRYHTPRIIFVNKMDREDADLQFCCDSVRKKFGVPTLSLHIPLRENNKFIGFVDVLTLRRFVWDTSGRLPNLNKINLCDCDDREMYERAREERVKLIDLLSGFDDGLANTIIETESLDNVRNEDVLGALRNVTRSQKAVPVLCGSSYKNIGIEPLMDAIILYLPSPMEMNEHFKCFDENVCAKAFKVLHDKKQGGALTFLRLYSGTLTKSQRLYNIQKNSTEQIGKLLVPFADDFQEVNELSNGNVGVVTGLKQTRSGDLVTSSASVAQKAKVKMSSLVDVEKLFNEGGQVPEPVFFCSIDPPSLSSQTTLDVALSELQREDPSLRVTYDAQTGQTILAGMGELHLEITRDRILKEYKVDVDLGRIQIAYTETPNERTTCDFTTETKIGNAKQFAKISLSLIPSKKETHGKGVLIFDKTPDAASNIASIYHKHLTAVRQGVDVALSNGPKVGSTVVDVDVMLHMLEVNRGTSESVIAATTTQCVNKMLRQVGTHILEPVMYLEVVCPDEFVSVVLADLSNRRVCIRNITVKGNNKLLLVEVPLSELMGYSTDLRTISSGTATYSMEFLEYRKMSPNNELKALQSIRGF